MKRVAQTQGGKDTGFDQEMSSNEAPKRATAAQLANRKIKAARERKTRVGSPNLSLPQPAANPFGSLNSNVTPAPSFSGPANGFTFGQSQSFSQPSSAPGTSNNGLSTSSSFGAEQSSSPGSFKLFGNQTNSAPPSFDFSSSSNNQQISNPFSNSNMSSNQNSGFQGFKGTMFNIPSTATQGEKKPDILPNGTGFFGASTTTTAPMFGATQATSAPIFNQSAGPNMFGQSNAPPNIFGAPQITSPTKGAEAMQMSPDGPKSTGQSIFNVSAPAPPVFKSPFSTPATGFNLGLSSTATTSASTPAWSFQPAASTPAPASSTSAFFGTTKPEEQKVSSATSGSTFFGTSKPEEQKLPATPAPGSLFFGAPKPDEQKAPGTPASGSILFGAPKADEPKPATTSAPASIFFGASKPEESNIPPKSATSTNLNTTSLFGAPTGPALFGQASQPPAKTQSTIFQNTPAASTPKPAGIFGTNNSFAAAPTTSTLFGHLAQPKDTAATPTAKDTSSIFSGFAQPKSESAPSSKGTSTPSTNPNAPTAASVFTPAASAQSSQPAFSIFGQATKPIDTPNPTVATTSGTPSIFANSPAGGSLFQRVAEPVKQNKNQKPVPAQVEEKVPESSTSIFASTNSSLGAQAQPPSNISTRDNSSNADKPFTAASGATSSVKPAEVPAPPKPKYTDASTETIFEAEGPLIDFRPEEREYPPNATEEVREQFLRAWRLSALNASFQEEIASVNCWSQDLDPIIAHYVMLRKMLGHPHPLVTTYVPIPIGDKQPWTPQPPFSSSSVKAKGTDTEGPAQNGVSSSKPSIPNGEHTASASLGNSHKRKALDVDLDEDGLSENAEKRTKTTGCKEAVNGDSTDEAAEATPSKTLSLFANSFVAQKSRGASVDSDGAASSEESESTEDESTDTNKQEDRTTTPSVSPPGSSSGGGRSLFDRIERDEHGQPIRQVQPEESVEDIKSFANGKNDTSSSIFGGSQNGSPFNATDSMTPPAGSTNGLDSTRSPSPLDPTKAKASPAPSIFAELPPSGSVLFGAGSSNAGAASGPTFSLFGGAVSSASSPSNSRPASATSNIFGAPSPTSTPPPTSSNLFGAASTSAPSIFANTSATSTPSNNNNSLVPPTSNIFGNLKATSSFAQSSGSGASAAFSPSGVTSVDPSRSATPAQSDTDNANEPSDEAEKHAQVDFTRGGPGEEDEDAVFECRSRAYQFAEGNWTVKGVGILRILKHRTTNKSRVLVRADPSGSVVLNCHLMPQIEYKQRGTNVQFVVPGETGFQQWMLRVNSEESAGKLKDLMEQHKKRD